MKQGTLLLVGLLVFVHGTNGPAQQAPVLEAVPTSPGTTVGRADVETATAPQPRYRLHFWYRFLPNGSMQVLGVVPGGPATRLSNEAGQGMLEAGDVITHVNDQPISSPDDYERALALAADREGKVKLRVRDVRTRQIIEWETVVDDRGAPPAGIGRRRPATRVKVVLIGLTADKHIGDACRTDVALISKYVHGLPNFAPESDLVEIDGEKVTARNILATIARLQVQPTDTLLCYYAGHGAYDPRLAQNDPSGGHFFSIPGQDLPRKRLMAALQMKRAQLTVLITDTCNVRGQIRGWGGGAVAVNAVTSKPFTDLLRNYTGIVDISGSSRGQYGWSQGAHGSCFTLGLGEALESCEEDAEVNWGAFLKTTSDKTSNQFQLLKRSARLRTPTTDDEARTLELLSRQEDQRPQAFQLRVTAVRPGR